MASLQEFIHFCDKNGEKNDLHLKQHGSIDSRGWYYTRGIQESLVTWLLEIHH